MKKLKRLSATFLTLTLVASVTVIPVSAASASEQQNMARALYSLKLFAGYDESGNNFGLTDIPTREQALIFQIRALGEDTAAKAWTGPSPYSDVPAGHWALPYIGYATQKGYTSGVGNGQFGLGQPASAQMMTTFVLRGIGYSDAAAGDFTYEKSLSFGKSLGINDSDVAPAVFTRGNAVETLYKALSAKTKSEGTLSTKLINKGVFSKAAYDTAERSVTGQNAVPTALTLDKTTLSMRVGESYGLVTKLTPSNAKEDITWTSGSTSVATVDSKGTVKALSTGKATITAKSYNGITATCSVTVSDETVKLNMVNYTGKSITKLYAPVSGSSSLGEDLITKTIADEGKSTVTYLYDTATRKRDIRAYYSNSSYYEYTGFDLSKASNNDTYYMYLDGSKLVVSTTNPGTADPTGISLDKTTISLQVGDKYGLTAKLTPSNAKEDLTWSSDNSNVASVGSSGSVKALKTGTATITVKTHNKKTATCKVTVTAATTEVAATGVSLDPTTASVESGKTVQLRATVAPSNATSKSVTWSSDSGDAKVDQNGLVTGVKAGGSATITAKSNNGKTATCRVTVTAAAQTEVTASSVRLNETSADLKSGQTLQLRATVEPSNAVNKDVTWSSDNGAVSVDRNGLLTAEKAGSATITVKTNNGKTAECKVTVTEPAPEPKPDPTPDTPSDGTDSKTQPDGTESVQ